jgi:hypothetical protein
MSGKYEADENVHAKIKKKGDEGEELAIREAEGLYNSVLAEGIRQDDRQFWRMGKVNPDGTRDEPPFYTKRVIGYLLFAALMTILNTHMYFSYPLSLPTYFIGATTFMFFFPAHSCAIRDIEGLTYWYEGGMVTFYQIVFLISWHCTYSYFGPLWFNRWVIMKYKWWEAFVGFLLASVPFAFLQADFNGCRRGYGPKALIPRDGDNAGFIDGTLVNTSFILYCIVTLPVYLFGDVWWYCKILPKRLPGYRVESMARLCANQFVWFGETACSKIIVYYTWWWLVQNEAQFGFVRHRKDAAGNVVQMWETYNEVTGIPDPDAVNCRWECFKSIGHRVLAHSGTWQFRFAAIAFAIVGFWSVSYWRNWAHNNKNQAGDLQCYKRNDGFVQRTYEFAMAVEFVLFFSSVQFNTYADKILLAVMDASGMTQTPPGVELLLYYVLFSIYKFLMYYVGRTSFGRNHGILFMYPMMCAESTIIYLAMYYKTAPFTLAYGMGLVITWCWHSIRDRYVQHAMRWFFVRMKWMDSGPLEDLVFCEETTLLDNQGALASIHASALIIFLALAEVFAHAINENGSNLYFYCFGDGACRATPATRFVATLIMCSGIITLGCVNMFYNCKRLEQTKNTFLQGNGRASIDENTKITVEEPHDWIPRIFAYKTANAFWKNHLTKGQIIFCISLPGRACFMVNNFYGSYVVSEPSDRKLITDRFFYTYLTTGFYDTDYHLW